MHHVRHHVNRRFIPGNELAIVPDIFRLLDCHADSTFRERFSACKRGLRIACSGTAGSEARKPNQRYSSLSRTTRYRTRHLHKRPDWPAFKAGGKRA